jgi:protein-tyrosine phosphatase
MLSRLFGSRKKEETTNTYATAQSGNWSFLKTDMHSHLIPGIDDGSPTIEDSIAMIRQLQRMGFESIVTTPHIKFDFYPNNPAIIQNGLKELQQAMNEQGLHVPIRAAAEYYMDDHFMQLLDAGTLMPIQDNEVLVEFSFVFEPIMLHETLFKIQTKGLKPIIAHPERYNYYHLKPDMYQSLKDRGCMLQLNTIALTGYYGKGVKDTAVKLLKEGLYDYCGTDMHHMRHAETMEKLMQSKNFELVQNYPFRNAAIKW